MPNFFMGRSRTCPLLAVTSKSGPRYLPMVLALAGDSTMTRFFPLPGLMYCLGSGGASATTAFFLVVLGFAAALGAAFFVVFVAVLRVAITAPLLILRCVHLQQL